MAHTFGISKTTLSRYLVKFQEQETATDSD